MKILFVPNTTSEARKALLRISMAFGVGLFCSAAQADVYRWISADGVTSFSGKRPDVQTPFETIVRQRDAEPATITEDIAVPAAKAEIPAPPPAPKVCDGEAGATAVGALAMVLNRAYIASIPDFVADNPSVFAADEFYDCLDAIFENALLHEQITGGDGGTISPDAPLAVLLETSPNLAIALRGLNDGITDEWQKILNHMQARRPRLEIDVGALTRLIRSVIVDAQAGATGTRLQAGAP